MTIDRFKQQLAEVFDDDLHTRRWHNIADYLIIGMILLSTVEIFLSTFDLHPALKRVLLWVDLATLLFFTVEVSLRIWVAPLVNPRFKGWKGRLKYCFTFNGFIDVISTFPYYLQWLVPFPLGWLRILRTSRTLRLFRISRYMKSWRLLSGTIAEKKRELIISMQFLIVITFILSLILFFCEHDRQPEVYDNGFRSVLWAFAQYIGDPGGFGDTPPVTVPGRIIACIVGLLGIAIVAVPAGILGAGFTEAIEKENSKEKLAENSDKLHRAFERKLDRPTGCQAVPFFRTLADIQARMHMTCDELIEAVDSTPGFRLINLAATVPTDRMPHDRLAVEHFNLNTVYGQMYDRGSRITIVSPSSFIDPVTGIFSFYLALFGGFNYISREIGEYAPYRSFFVQGDELQPGQAEYNADLTRLMNRPDSWSFSILASSGANEPEYDTQVHLGVGGAKGDETLDADGLLIHDRALYASFYKALSEVLKTDFNIDSDNGRYFNTAGPRLWQRRLDIPSDSNNVVVRLAWSAFLWDSRRLAIARTIASTISEVILGQPLPEVPQLKVKSFGFSDYQ